MLGERPLVLEAQQPAPGVGRCLAGARLAQLRIGSHPARGITGGEQ